MRIAKDTVVSLLYRVHTDQGRELDEDEANEPLVYLHGHSEVIRGLERGLEGREPGERVRITVAPEDAYGIYQEDLDLRLPREAFPEDAWPQLLPGVQFRARHPEPPHAEVLFRVVRREGDTVLITGNHPLAGETLVFSVEVLDVRPPTLVELQQGRALGGEEDLDIEAIGEIEGDGDARSAS